MTLCVIYACQTTLPDDAELKRGSETNTDGAGVAFLRAGKIHWKKDLKDWLGAKAFIEKEALSFPYAIHFRSASVGGNSDHLAHPFPVAKGVPNWLEGSADEVLFHNGHLAGWSDLVLKAGLASKEKFPEGAWSDSRGLAWLTWLKGPGILPFVVDSSRVLLFHAAASTWEGDVYSPGDDHFAFYGKDWIHDAKKGWSQSVNTYTRYTRTPDRWMHYRGGDVDEIEDYSAMGALDACGTALAELTSTEVVTSPTPKVNVLTAKDAYVWTVEELNGVLAELKKELGNAKLAAGL